MLIKYFFLPFALLILSSPARAATNLIVNCSGTNIYDLGRGSTSLTLNHSGIAPEGQVRYTINTAAVRTLVRVDAEVAVLSFADANGDPLRVIKFFAPNPSMPSVIIPVDGGALGRIYVINEGLDFAKFTRKASLIFELNGVKVSKTGCSLDGTLVADREAAFSAAGWLKAFK